MPIAVVTGASTGIGRELAFECARDGYDLILIARSEAPLELVAQALLEKTGRKAQILVKDLSDTHAAGEVFEILKPIASQIEVLINNAGFGLLGHFWELSEEEQVRMIQLNVASLTHLTRLFLPGFIERRRGRVMNIASTAAFQPGPLMAVYYASKSYVVSLSVALNNEAKDFGVTVTALCPGPTVTGFAQRAGFGNSKIFTGGLAMSAIEVARIGYAAMKRGKPLVVAGRMNSLMALGARCAPMRLTAAMARRFQEGGTSRQRLISNG